jgi:diaminohydroxyphosphoribosylaminopyrimidine deaminase / 5-amino-6-(5-phosphoribosylamino)uracil reductase
MTIDEATAWAALLRARAAWRDSRERSPATIQGQGGVRLTLLPDGAWEAGGGPVAPTVAALLDLYLPLLPRPRWVIGQLGQSLDGRIATASGHSHYVTGPESLLHLHRLRALCDAVVVGAGTVAADDPQLTVRRCAGDNPLRVVLDPRLALGSHHRVFTDSAAPTLVICAAENRPAEGGDGIAGLACGAQGFAPRDVLDLLAARGATRVLVEGGGVTVSRFLAAGALDALHVVVAPLLIGSGRHGVNLPEIATLADALRPPCRRFALGDDMLFELSLA